MAVPTYVTGGAASATAGPTDPTPSYPASIQSGDLLILQVYMHDGGGATVTPTGWTLIQSFGTAAAVQKIYAKRADGTETGTLTVDCTVTAGNANVARIHQVRNWNDTGTITDAFEGTNTNNATSTTDGAAAVTTTDQDRLLMIFRGFNASIASSVDAYSGGGVTWTHQNEQGGTTGNNYTFACDTAPVAAAASVSGATDAITSTAWQNIGTAIRPFKSRTPAINHQNPAIV